MRALLISAALLALVAIPAEADRSVTDAERARLADALRLKAVRGQDGMG
jgi:hypothetical protein